MDRRYYFAKLAMVIVAVALALAGSGMSAVRNTHSPRGQAQQYSASTQLQDAAWRATSSAARTIACLASRALHNAAVAAP